MVVICKFVFFKVKLTRKKADEEQWCDRLNLQQHLFIKILITKFYQKRKKKSPKMVHYDSFSVPTESLSILSTEFKPKPLNQIFQKLVYVAMSLIIS